MASSSLRIVAKTTPMSRTRIALRAAVRRRPGRDVVEPDRRRQCPAGEVDLWREHDREHQAGDHDAEQRVEPERPPEAPVVRRTQQEDNGDRQHDRVALDREETEQPPQPDPDRLTRLPGVRVGATGEDQHQLDDERHADHSRDQSMGQPCGDGCLVASRELRHPLMVAAPASGWR